MIVHGETASAGATSAQPKTGFATELIHPHLDDEQTRALR
jgi:hypothetical protein